MNTILWHSLFQFLSQYVFIASWLSVPIALCAMIFQARRSNTPIDWNAVVIRVVILTCLAVILTPHIDRTVRSILGGFGGFLLGPLIVRRN